MVVKSLNEYEEKKEGTLKNLIGKVGCVVEFHGYVRRYSVKNGKKYEVTYLDIPNEITSHLEDVIKKAEQKFNVLRIIAYHNTGRLKVGEKISSICVFSSHRNEAYQALEFVVSEIKKFH